MNDRPEEVSRLLEDYTRGDPKSLDRLLPIVYEELHSLAAGYLHRERVNHTLQPTALVHEAYLRLLQEKDRRWENRSHFYGIAAMAMRRILVDHARRHRAQKRQAEGARVPLELAPLFEEPSVDLVALDDALTRLAKFDERKSRVVELRFFGGYSIEETAEVLSVSHATVERDWSLARAWLHREIEGVRDGP